MDALRKQTRISVKELTLLSIVLLVLVAVAANMVQSAQQVEEYSGRALRVSAVNRELLDQLCEDLSSAVALVAGERVMGRLDFPQRALPIACCRLPRMSPTGSFRRGAWTGNALLFVAAAGTDEIRCAEDASYRIDVVRFVCIYLAEAGDGPRQGCGVGLNLCRFVSVPLADANQVDLIVDVEDRRAVLRALAEGRRVTHLWRRGTDGRHGLWSFDANGSEPVECRSLKADQVLSQWGMLDFGAVSVATNHAVHAAGVGAFGHMTDGFPHGFEVQISGPATARRVMFHLSLVTTNPEGPPAFADLRSIALVRVR